jgi:hypothetical protein
MKNQPPDYGRYKHWNQHDQNYAIQSSQMEEEYHGTAIENGKMPNNLEDI